MKKYLSSSLVLLGLCCALNTTAQNLNTRQLLDLNQMPQMQRDDYLIKRGWLFGTTQVQGDSLYKVYWRFYNSKRTLIAQVETWQQLGQQEALIYTTVLRPAFDVIRTDVLASGMEERGTDNTEAMTTFYRDSEYDVNLTVRNHEGRVEYSAYLQKHGLTKAYTEEDGKLVPTWITVPPMTAAQKRYYDAYIDSAEKASPARRGSDRPTRPATEKSRN